MSTFLSRKYVSPLKKLALAYEGSGTERMETIEAYAVPPWYNRVPLVCEAEREAAKIAAKNVNDIVIATSASDRGGLVGMGGIVVQRSPGQTDRMVARYSATLGSRDDQNPYTAELEAIAMALRCMPDGLQCRELTVLSSSQSSLKAIARPQQQSGQTSIRQIYEHIERLRKGNNRVKMIWVPSRDDDLSMSREAKRQAKKATRAGCTPQSLPYQARSTRLRLAVSQLHQQTETTQQCPWWMSGVANPASDVIIVMGDDPDGSGGGYHRPQRKRVRTTKVLEMEQQNGDMEWQEEGETSEGALGQNRARKQAAPKSAGGMVEAVQSLKQLLEQDLNKKIEAMKAEFQLEFTKLSDRMAEEVARATAQMA
ncbi:hypothetical protein LZL87_014082 [Fusarium oxysporum]|nr:hypothetical protein LZL87_014082 [Fusarium oxysporum]